ncbi:ribosome recycling factor [Hydrogenispora ethanolica]|uniref:Ribosome-recycling factor n=1 Tax=Hydrogenispora ethanolica TaxID=1082276 RepID=A0A4R1RSV7_HYDET|nr:ribosome recycling factor [Hydrogenispora ethanolica]TCL69419.1 ribosome recycling factor [Hydrogenispora ethanolica]
MIKDLLKETENHMKGAIEATKREFQSIRTSRANPNILEKVHVEYYGTPTPLNQLANISVPDARSLVIQPWDKSVLSVIEKAIQKADLGLNPVNDGTVIRLPIPQLTEERRKELVKVIKKEAEEKRVAIRNLRRDTNDKLKALEKDGKITEDENKKALDDVQKLTDRFITEVDKLLDMKEKEIMEV